MIVSLFSSLSLVYSKDVGFLCGHLAKLERQVYTRGTQKVHMKSEPQSLLQKIQNNWKSGLTVSLVSIPLSVSLAVASGSTPVIGIITAVWAGLIASIFAGSNYNITGPTGALSGILATFALINGAEALSMVAIMTGILILVAYIARFEKYLIFIPANTIQGFTLGVAFIIGLNQLNFALGLSNLPKHERFIENVIESLKHLPMTSISALIVFAVFLLLMLIIPKVTPKIPGAIILAPIGILLGYLSSTGSIPLALETLGSRFQINPSLFLPVNFVFSKAIVVTSITVALVAILETMLSARIADVMTKTKHNKRKEMLALGLANIASGLAGGIPATAALARTSLNIKTGANSKASAMISSICIAIISLFLLSYFKYIPLAVIAAILVTVAIRMVEREHFERMFKLDKKSFAIAMIVAFVTIYEDPIIGILLGTTISLFFFLDKLSRGQFDLVVNDINKKIVAQISGEEIEQITDKSHTLVYSIKGHLTYVDGQAHVSRFEGELNGYENIILRLRELYFIDLDGIDAFDEIIEIITSRGKKVLITGVNSPIAHMLTQSRHYKELADSGLVFPHTTDALKYLGFKLNVEREYNQGTS